MCARLRKATLKKEKKLRAAPTTFATATDAAAVIVDVVVVCCAGASLSSSLRCTAIVVVRDLFTNLNKIHLHTYIHMYTKMPENTAKLVSFRVRSNILWAQILQGRKSQCVSSCSCCCYLLGNGCCCSHCCIYLSLSLLLLLRVSTICNARNRKKSIMAISVNNPL